MVINNKLKINSLCIPFSIISILLIVLGVQISVISIFALFFSAFCLFFMNERERLFFMFALMPFAQIFKLSSDSQSFFTYLQIIYIFMVLFQKNKINKNFLVGLLLFMLYLIFELALNNDLASGAKEFLKVLIVILFFYTAMQVDFDNEYFKRLVNILLFSIIISSLLGFLRPYWSGLNNIIGNAKVSGNVIRFSGLMMDPNYYSINLILPISIIMVLFAKHRIGIVPLFMAFGLGIFGCFTYSKSFFLIFAILILVFIFLLLYNKRYGAIAFFCVMLLIAVLFLYYVGYIETILERFNTSEGLSGITTGRSNMWKNYINAFIDDPLRAILGFGLGTGMPGDAFAHNTILQLIYRFGIAGSTLFVLLFILLAKGIKSTCNNFQKSIPAFIWFLMIMFLDILFSFDFVFQLILIVYMFKYDFRKDELLSDQPIIQKK